jgi:hypothetical protein
MSPPCYCGDQKRAGVVVMAGGKGKGEYVCGGEDMRTWSGEEKGD